MIEELIKLIILFFVIFDPPASFAVFLLATEKLKPKEKKLTAFYAVGIAFLISLVFLIFGQKILEVFSTSITSFQVAGGIVLGLLGLKMIMGHPLVDVERSKGKGIASIIATPLLTGPAAITAILLTVKQSGILITGLSIFIVLTLTGFIFAYATTIKKVFGKTAIQISSTLMGLVILSWGVDFVIKGIVQII